jgi:hypothetical protein
VIVGVDPQAASDTTPRLEIKRDLIRLGDAATYRPSKDFPLAGLRAVGRKRGNFSACANLAFGRDQCPERALMRRHEREMRPHKAADVLIHIERPER